MALRQQDGGAGAGGERLPLLTLAVDVASRYPAGLRGRSLWAPACVLTCSPVVSTRYRSCPQRPRVSRFVSHFTDSASEQSLPQVQVKFQSEMPCISTSGSADVRKGRSQRLAGGHTRQTQSAEICSRGVGRMKEILTKQIPSSDLSWWLVA